MTKKQRTGLSGDDVRLILALAAERQILVEEVEQKQQQIKQLSNYKIAEKFGCSPTTISALLLGKTHKRCRA